MLNTLRKIASITITVLFLFTVSGCGNKGPLEKPASLVPDTIESVLTDEKHLS